MDSRAIVLRLLNAIHLSSIRGLLSMIWYKHIFLIFIYYMGIKP